MHDQAQWAMRGRVYYNGSCDQRRDAEITRAAYAVVEVDEHGMDVASRAREFYNNNTVHPDGFGENELRRQLATAKFLEGVKAVGLKAYLRVPRVQLVRLRSLCDRGRAAPPSVASGKLQRLRNLSAAEVAVFARLFGAPTPRTPRASSGRLPNEIFWHVLAFWRTDRD